MNGAQAAEACAADECEASGDAQGSSSTGSWADQGWLVFLAGLVCFLHVVMDVGWHYAKKLLFKGGTP